MKVRPWVLFFVLHVVFGDDFPATSNQAEEIPLFDWNQIKQDILPVLDECPNGPDWACHDNNQQMKNCHCDSSCIKYGDCCLDEAQETIEQKSTSLFNNWSCKSIRYGNNYLYMKTTCPSHYSKDLSIKSRCELTDPYHTYHLDLPVIDGSEDTTYSNIFCAICNGVEINSLQMFRHRNGSVQDIS